MINYVLFWTFQNCLESLGGHVRTLSVWHFIELLHVKLNAQKRCRVCYMHGRRKDVGYYCPVSEPASALPKRLLQDLPHWRTQCMRPLWRTLWHWECCVDLWECLVPVVGPASNKKTFSRAIMLTVLPQMPIFLNFLYKHTSFHFLSVNNNCTVVGVRALGTVLMLCYDWREGYRAGYTMQSLLRLVYTQGSKGVSS